MKYYLAGPMTGIPAFNFPELLRIGGRLREAGLDVVNPAELDNEADRQRAMASPDGGPIHYESGKTWGDFLARDVKLLADDGITAIIVAPGWQKSRGARLETFVGAAICGMPVYEFVETQGEWALYTVTLLDLYRAWTQEPDLYVYKAPFKAQEVKS